MKIDIQRPHERHRRFTTAWKIGIVLGILLVSGVVTLLVSLFWGLKPLPMPPAVRLQPREEPIKVSQIVSENGALFYFKAYDLLVPLPRGSENQIDLFLSSDLTAEVEDVEKILLDHVEALSMIRKGTQAVVCQLPWLDQEWMQQGNGASVVALQKLAKLLLCQGLLNEKKGEVEKAMADYLTVVRFGKSCARGASQGGCQVGADIRKMGIYFLRSLVWRGQLSKESLRSISRDLDEIAEGETPFAETIRYELFERKQSVSLSLGDNPFHFPYSEHDVHRMLEAAYGEAILELEKPSWETASLEDWERKWFVGPDSYAANAFDRKYSMYLFLVTMTSFRQTYDAILAKTVHQDGAIVACALKQYVLEHGQLPDRLGKLVPDFLKAVPIDPYDGNPLRYATKGNEWVVWSIGSDKIDNKAESRMTDTDYRGDIVVDSQLFGPDFRRDFPKIRGE